MIGSMQFSALVNALGATAHGGDCEFSVLSTDSRKMPAGAVFLALAGEHFDGNNYVSAAVAAGACGAIVSRLAEVHIPQLLVRDTLAALLTIAQLNRQRSSAHFVAITGSQGKTTVKEMLGSILRQRDEVLVTRGNLNNRIGVPLTLLELTEMQRYAVIELGANMAGEIADTAGITAPQVVVLTNASPTHLSGFGDLDGVVEAKGEIIDGCAPDGTVILNADDAAFMVWKQRAGARRVQSFGLQSATRRADYRAEQIKPLAAGSQFMLASPQGRQRIRLSLPGKHNVANALAAAAAAIESGATLSDVAAGLALMQPVPGRLAQSRCIGGALLIDDSYNASPASMRAAIDVLMTLSIERDAGSMLIAGDMAELGEEEVLLHRQCGEYAREQGVAQLACVGPLAAAMADAYGDGALHFADQASLLAWAMEEITENRVVLVKGSRSAGMDRIVAALKQGDETAC